jgi:hypothetical protein
MEKEANDIVVRLTTDGDRCGFISLEVENVNKDTKKQGTI